MSARLLDGRPLARRLLADLAPGIAEVRRARGEPPRLAIVTHGDDAAAAAYLRAKLSAASSAGLLAQAAPCAPGTDPAALIDSLGQDPRVDAILVEQPLPAGLSPERIFSAIPPEKDAEGLHPLNYGRFFMAKTSAEISAPEIIPPCTAAAIMLLLRQTPAAVSGLEAVVVGRSGIVGRPAAHWLCALGATVTLCHSRTEDLPGHVRRADVVVACLGRPRFIQGDWLKPGAVVLDAGINRLGEAWVGDVDFDAACRTASFITPVPGGVGPVTTAVVMAHAVRAAKRRLETAG